MLVDDHRVAAASAPTISIVVPTRNEAGNVAALVAGLEQSLTSNIDGRTSTIAAEVLFVDDSDDSTPAVVRRVARSSSLDVRLIRREPGHRDGGLGGAVLAGFRQARGTWAVVMDGDLQHPPEVVPDLVVAASQGGTDIAYGTRYAAGADEVDPGGDPDAPSRAAGLDGPLRRAVSTWSTRLAKLVFPRRLRGVSDPMTGFFAVRLEALDLESLQPSGYKIFLEILTHGARKTAVGVPYRFMPRHEGQSKASVRQGIIYLRRLLALRLGISSARLLELVRFLLVGASGVAVNTAALWFLSSVWSLPYLLGSLISTQVAILWNFVLLERLVFHDANRDFLDFCRGLARFWLLNLLLVPVQLGLLAVAVETVGLPTLPANVLVLGLVFLLRYLVTAGWVFRWRSDPLDVVAAAAPPTRRRRLPSRSAATLAVRLCVPPVATLIAFPALAVGAVKVFAAPSALPAVTLVAVLVAALTVVAMRARPGPDEPPVHDRQVDVILAVPFGVTAAWLTFGWGQVFSMDQPVDPRLIVAAAAFLTGASLTVLGTRLSARIRWALAAPLLALPAVFPVSLAAPAGLPVGLVPAWIYVAVVTLALAGRLRRSSGRLRPDGPGPVALMPVHQQVLPPAGPALAVVVVAAALLALSALLASNGVIR